MANKIRYSLTLLSYVNKDHAVNDEMMIDKNNGSLYYKRPDGKIIQCSSASSGSSTNNIGGSNVFSSITNTGYSMSNIYVGDPPTGLLTLTDQTLDTQPQITSTVTVDNEIFTSSYGKAFFISVTTRNTDNLYLDMLTYLRNSDPNSTPSENNGVISYTIVGQLNGADVDGSSQTFSKDIRINNLTAVEIPDEYINNDAYDSLKITINSVSCTVKDYYDPEAQSHSDVFAAIMPDDSQICFANVDLAYFTMSEDTIFVDDLNKVLYICDTYSALQLLTNNDTRGYVDRVIHPAILHLYNSGLSTSSSYIKEFDITDWTRDETTSIYSISIPKTTHMLIGEITSHVYYYEDGLYKSDYGVWDDINYKTAIDPSTKAIMITTESPFKGKIVLVDDSKFGDTAHIDPVGDIYIDASLYSQYKQITLGGGDE